MAFKVGDVVRLKSGMVTMTVTATSETSAKCCWENRNDAGVSFPTATFPQETLVAGDAVPEPFTVEFISPDDD